MPRCWPLSDKPYQPHRLHRRRMLTVRGDGEYLSCSESLIYAQMKDGRLRGVKVGRRRLIPMRELVRIAAV